MAVTKSALSNDEWWHVTYPLQPIFRHQIAGLVRLALMLTSDAFLILKIQRVLMTWVQGISGCRIKFIQNHDPCLDFIGKYGKH